MSFYKPIHLLFGEYIFETDEKSFPRFANFLVNEKLNFWGAKHLNGRVRFHTSVFSAEAINNLATHIHVPIELVGKRGLPFFFSRYRHRYGIIAGMALGLFLIFFSQLFVWKIQISGNTVVSVGEIEQALSQCGVSVGSFIPYIDTASAENILLLNNKALSSASIGIRGNHIQVSVLERTLAPEIVDTQGYYNVVAECDGVIIDVDAADGTPEVNVGDVVQKGQLLINSFMEAKNGTFRPTHARGIVYAAVARHFEITVPLERQVKSYTGNTQTKTVYSILGWDVANFFHEETDYEYFDALNVKNDLQLFGCISLPIRKNRVTYSEYTLKTQKITPEDANQLALAELDNILQSLGLEVLECKTSFTTDEKNGVCTLSANTVLKQNIAKEVEFNLNQSMSDKLPKPSE